MIILYFDPQIENKRCTETIQIIFTIDQIILTVDQLSIVVQAIISSTNKRIFKGVNSPKLN